MKLIEFTDGAGRKVAVNPQHVVYIVKDYGQGITNALLTTSGGMMGLSGTYEENKRKLDEA
jgi:hypothetical protein